MSARDGGRRASGDRPSSIAVRRVAGRWALGLVLTAGAGTVAGFFGAAAWWLDLFAHFRMLVGRLERFGPYDEPTVVARLETEAGPVALALTHPMPPIGREAAAARDGHLASLAAARAGWGDLVVVMGDLDATPWSAAFRRLVEVADLRDVRRGHGLLPTWPSALPLPGIPIDHVLTSPGLVPVRVERGPDVGSDHRPLFVELALPTAR